MAYNVNAIDIKIFQGLKIPTKGSRMTTIFPATMSPLGEMRLKDDGTTNVKKF